MCPACETVCDPGTCTPVGVAVCSPLCEETSCSWNCELPLVCPQPTCQLQCEHPACELNVTALLEAASTSFLTPSVMVLLGVLLLNVAYA